MTTGPTTLIRNASWVVAYDAARDRHVYLKNADVAFAGDTLLHVGPGFAGKADLTVDGTDKAVLPGLVNVHGHLGTEALGKGFFEDLGNHNHYMSRLYEYIYVVRPPNDATRRAVTRTTVAELLRSGCTTVADMSIPYEGWIATFSEIGVRAYLTPMFKSASWSMSNGHRVDYVWDEEGGKRDFKRALDVIEEARGQPGGLLGGMVMPAQADTCTPELLVAAHDAALERGLPYQIHSGQSVIEFHEMVRRHGKTATAFLRDLGVLGRSTTIAHSLFIDRHPWLSWHQDEDIHILAETGTSVAHCPMTFAYRGAAMNDFGTYRKAGVNMSLGTDTYPHNMVEEMRIALFAAKYARRHVDHTRTEDVFTAATLGGARVLGRDDIGRLAAGARADLFLLDLLHPAMRPCRDPLRSFIYSAGDRAVTDVFVGGRQLVRGRELTTIDLDRALAELDIGHARAMADVASRDWASRSTREISPLALEVQEAGQTNQAEGDRHGP
jgi:cytosine/adenosine deaminase-related metal-dependent hydrolase